MLYLAVVNLNLSPDEFWGLSWYEYDLYALRYNKNLDREKFLWESDWDRTRKLWYVLINSNSQTKYNEGDLIKLSWDDEEVKNKVITSEKFEHKFPKIIKKDGK